MKKTANLLCASVKALDILDADILDILNQCNLKNKNINNKSNIKCHNVYGSFNCLRFYGLKCIDIIHTLYVYNILVVN